MNHLLNIFALEGPDGVGKSTAVKRILDTFAGLGIAATALRTPGGTPLGAKLREILLHAKDIAISSEAMSLLFTADHVAAFEAAAAEAAQGKIVIIDRCYWSNYAYRCAEGMDPERVMSVNQYLPFTLDPAHCIYLHAPLDVLRARLDAARGDKPDRFEGRGPGFQAKVAAGYDTLHAAGLLTRFDANRPVDALVGDVVHHITKNSPAGREADSFITGIEPA